MAARSGRFIVFEGCEGAGKSTQTQRLAERLKDQGAKVVLTREPGGRPGIDHGIAKIRSLLVEAGHDWSPKTEMLLFAAGRHEHVAKVIRPALADGAVVICDRFTDSTLAYQGHGRGLGPELCEELRAIACEDLRPDLTFVIDVPAEIGLGRSLRRATDATRFEQEDIAFHNRVRAAFLQIAAADPERYALVDGQMDEGAVELEIKRRYFEAFEMSW